MMHMTRIYHDSISSTLNKYLVMISLQLLPTLNLLLKAFVIIMVISTSTIVNSYVSAIM